MFKTKEQNSKYNDYESNSEETPLSNLLNKKERGPGGTSGGFLEFFLGLGLTVAGGYLITQQVVITSGYWNLFGQYTFGLTLVPLLFGIGMLFFNGRSTLGRLLTFTGAVIILFGVIASLRIYFSPTSLFNTLMMFGLLAGGLGLIARSLRPH